MLFPGVEAHVVRKDGSEADFTVNEVGELYVLIASALLWVIGTTRKQSEKHLSMVGYAPEI